MLRRRVPALAKAGGLPFATLFYLAGDEGMNWAFGTTAPPREFPWQAHARGFAGHAAFVAVTELVCRSLDR